MQSSPTSQNLGTMNEESQEDFAMNEFIDENDHVDIEGYLAKYPNDGDAPDLVERRHFVRMTIEQRSFFFGERDKTKAEKIREDISKRYNLSADADIYTILAVDKFDTEHKTCEGCKGDICKRNRNKGQCEYDEPILVWDNGKATFEHRICIVHSRYAKQAALERKFSSAKIPKLYRGKTFEDYTETVGNKKALKCAKWILENNEYGMFLTGRCGCGKTMLSAIVANESIKRGRSVLFATVPRLLSDIKATFDEAKGESTLSVLKSIESVDVLVLDDLGTEKASEWVAETLFSIINERYHEQRQTIITSNYTAERLESNLNGDYSETGTRILSRLRSMCKHVEITDNDWRMK